MGNSANASGPYEVTGEASGGASATTGTAHAGDELYRLVAPRLGREYLEARLAIESEGDARVFGQGRNFFHPENWIFSQTFLRRALRMTLLYDRARRNALQLQTRHNDIALERLPAPFDGFTTLHLSDLHADMNAALPEVLCGRLQSLEYDLCVLTGDYRYGTRGSWEPALDAVERIVAQIHSPVYAVLGNHDSIRMVPRLEAMGMRVLLNESVPIERDGASIRLAGIDDPHYFRGDDLPRACREIPPGSVSILLAHSPEIYRQAAEAGFDALLCGHTHGGQIRLPGGIPVLINANCPRRFAAGRWNFGSLQGYTSMGAGSSILDVRLNCPPEITLHRLRPAAG